MASVDYSASVTQASLVAQSPNMQAQLWDKVLEVFEQQSDFFQSMEGSGMDALIRTRTDTAAGRGQRINFRIKSGLYNEPHLGDQLFETPADFENYRVNSYQLEVDFLRHAVSYTARTEEALGLRGELNDEVPMDLGMWLGRQKTERLLMMFINQVPAANVVTINGKQAVGQNSSAVSANYLNYQDTLTFVSIVNMRTQLQRLGGKPARIGTDSQGNSISKNVVIATSDALYGLENDSDYKGALKTTRDTDAARVLFDGGWTEIRGEAIKEYRVIDHDGNGAIGSPLNPKAYLGNTITAGSTTVPLVITGTGAVATGGSSSGANPGTNSAGNSKNYFKFFPNFAYQFQPDVTLTQNNNTYYFLIINAQNDPLGANLIGMYSYTTGNNGVTITTVNNLGPTASGAQVTQFGGGYGNGGVTWNTGVWAGVHTTAHSAGATIVPCNQIGMPFGYTLMLMAGAAYRGYGKDRNKRSVQEFEGGFVKQIYITSIFGQTPRLDAAGRAPGVLVLQHALTIPGLPIPNAV